MINKVDRAFFELKHDSATIYQNFSRVIESANVIFLLIKNKIWWWFTSLSWSCYCYFWFCSSLLGFTITIFANMYAAKFKLIKKDYLVNYGVIIILILKVKNGNLKLKMKKIMNSKELFVLWF